MGKSTIVILSEDNKKQENVRCEAWSRDKDFSDFNVVGLLDYKIYWIIPQKIKHEVESQKIIRLGKFADISAKFLRI